MATTPGPASADDEILFSSDFDDAAGTAGWSVLGTACFAGVAAVEGDYGCDSETGVAELGGGEGALQLTGTDPSQTGGAVNDQLLDSSDTVTVSFDQYQYGGLVSGEGIAFFVAAPVDGQRRLGAGGGALGYSPGPDGSFLPPFPPDQPLRKRTNHLRSAAEQTPGLEGAYAGVGLDVGGDFSSDSFDGAGCAERDSGDSRNSVTVRGPEGGPGSDIEVEGLSGYCHVGTTPLGEMPLGGSDLEDARRTVRVTIAPTADGGCRIGVEIDADGEGAGEALFAPIGTYVIDREMPDQYQVGFTASTVDLNLIAARSRVQPSGFSDFHLIDNVRVTTPQTDPGPGPGPGPRPPTNPDPQPAPIPTTTDITVTRDGLSATVSPPARVDPPTGEVVFSADGEELDTVELEVVDGVATAVSDETVPPGEDVDFTAAYVGEGNYEPSEDLYERVDPTIRATVVTDEEPNEAGWYSDPLRIRFSCTRGSAPIVGGCPDPVYRKNTHPRKFFERSIAARDGGGATVVVPIKVDHRGPVITVIRAKGSPYPRDAQPISCTAFDGRSGVKRACWVEYEEFETTPTGRVRRHFTARSTDVAGNVSVRRNTFWIRRDR